jgi:GNAT superfamily N-acetyltransferase
MHPGNVGKQFQDLEISHLVPRGTDIISVSAKHPEHGDIGRLSLHTKNYVLDGDRPHTDDHTVVSYVEVKPEFRRQGVATAMWNYAKAQGFKPHHSSVISDSGYAWAKTTEV